MQLVREPDAAPLLPHVQDRAASFLLHHGHRRVELRTAVAAFGAEHVAREAFGVDAHQHRFAVGDIALHEREMFQPRRERTVHRQAEMPPRGRHVHLLHLLDEPFVAAAVCDQLRDGHEPQTMALHEFLKIVEPRHRPVVLHDLAAEPHLLQPRQAAQIHGRLGVSRALQHAALPRLKREHVPRAAEIRRLRVRLHARERRQGALRRRDAGGRRDRVDRDRERRLVVVGVRLDHLMQIEPMAPVRRHGHADEPLGVGRHEIHVGGRGETRRADAVSLVLAVLVIRHHDDLAACERGEAILDSVKLLFQNGAYFTTFPSCAANYRRASALSMTATIGLWSEVITSGTVLREETRHFGACAESIAM